MAQLEFFGMSCARQADIVLPKFFLIEASVPRVALAVKRFDMEDKEGRLHFLSFQSLTGVEEQLGLPYSRMADIIKKISGNPENDLHTLYKQMAINVIIHNCDDHLKNFSMLYNPAMQRFCLSPAYDIVPNLWQQEHILSVAGKTRNINIDDLIKEGLQFSLSKQRSLQLLNTAVDAVASTFQQNKQMLRQLSSRHSLCRKLLESIRGQIANFQDILAKGQV
jgi:serine/threonine-protein kinase HipA